MRKSRLSRVSFPAGFRGRFSPTDLPKAEPFYSYLFPVSTELGNFCKCPLTALFLCSTFHATEETEQSSHSTEENLLTVADLKRIFVDDGGSDKNEEGDAAAAEVVEAVEELHGDEEDAAE